MRNVIAVYLLALFTQGRPRRCCGRGRKSSGQLLHRLSLLPATQPLDCLEGVGSDDYDMPSVSLAVQIAYSLWNNSLGRIVHNNNGFLGLQQGFCRTQLLHRSLSHLIGDEAGQSAYVGQNFAEFATHRSRV